MSVWIRTAASGQTDSIIYRSVQKISYRSGENQTDFMREQCHLDLYYPVNFSDFPTVIWIHGGGLTGGVKMIPEQLRNQGLAIAAIEYRLHPLAKCPEYIEDAAAAIAWVFKHIKEYGGSVRKIIVAGTSAGGYLTMMTGLDKRWLAPYGVDPDSIAMLFPFTGHAITHFTIREEQGIPQKQPVLDEFAPLFHVRADAPPMFLFTGDRELELLGRYEENAYLLRMMKLVGHKDCHLYEYPGFDHMDFRPSAFQMMLKILRERGYIL